MRHGFDAIPSDRLTQRELCHILMRDPGTEQALPWTSCFAMMAQLWTTRENPQGWAVLPLYAALLRMCRRYPCDDRKASDNLDLVFTRWAPGISISGLKPLLSATELHFVSKR